jgi:5-methylcytosine-specific restriction enzyme subunit McrC
MGRPIPIRNIYYLLLYAWNRLPEGKSIDVSGLESPDLPNLLTKVLLDGVRNLQRRGLDRGYIEHDEDLTRPRGRMCLADTLSRGLLSRVQVACHTDDLSYDVLHNRIIKSTLEQLARTREIDLAQRDALIATIRGLFEIASVTITASDFGRVQLHGNNAFYGLLMRVCALVYGALMPEPGEGRFRFRDVLADPQTMGYIFQDFVRNFFSIEQARFSVKSEQINWPITPDVGQGHFLIPTMNTDVSLFDGNRTVIVECKWTTTTLQTYREAKRLRSEHLYQLSAYVRSHSRAKSDRKTVEGLLLYPLVDEPVDVVVRVDGQWIRARTIDLSVDWEAIHDQLLYILDPVGVIGNGGSPYS